MHKFLRAVGFSQFVRKKDIDVLLQRLIREYPIENRIVLDSESNLCEIRAQVSKDMGLSLFGEEDKEGNFHLEYYYPYLLSEIVTSNAFCSIQRHTEKETHAGFLDEYRVGISLIFYLSNEIAYLKERKEKQGNLKIAHACLSGLSTSGKILFPVKKTQKQIEMAKVYARDRNNQLEAAKNGDEDAIDKLTLEDVDLYSRVSRRVMTEDIYSIIDSYFMPCGIECDQYSVMGEIMDVTEQTNQITQEEMYILTIESSDITFKVGINKMDLLGEPAVGRRFKGKIWMQGSATFAA
ncbi:MAG: DUF3881 family protein [bacterium]|nr:DUF3881 family protein [bacterium]